MTSQADARHSEFCFPFRSFCR